VRYLLTSCIVLFLTLVFWLCFDAMAANTSGQVEWKGGFSDGIAGPRVFKNGMPVIPNGNGNGEVVIPQFASTIFYYPVQTNGEVVIDFSEIGTNTGQAVSFTSFDASVTTFKPRQVFTAASMEHFTADPVGSPDQVIDEIRMNMQGSISFWFNMYVDSGNLRSAFIIQDAAVDNYLHIFFDDRSSSDFVRITGVQEGSTVVDFRSAAQSLDPLFGSQHMFTLTQDGSKMRMYIDAIEVANTTTNTDTNIGFWLIDFATNLTADAGMIKMGQIHGGASPYIAGTLSDHVYYDVTLDDQEVFDLFFAQRTSQGWGAFNQIDTQSNNLEVAWGMEYLTSTTSADQSSKDNHAIVSGAILGSAATNGFSILDGVNDTLISEFSTGVDGSESRSLTIWSKRTSTTTDDVIWSMGAKSAADEFALLYLAGGSDIQLTINGSTLTWSGIGTLDWQHLVVTYSSGTQIQDARIYVDSMDQGIADTIVGGTTMPTTTDSTVRLGVDVGGSGPYLGSVDDFRLYSTVLSSGEISTMHTTTESVHP